MAQSLRRPLSSVLGLSSSRTCRRCFSQYHPLSGIDRSQQGLVRPREAANRSLRLASKQAQMIPTDMGLLENTYIPTTGANLPSPLTSPNDFLWTQINRVYYWGRNIFSLVVTKWSGPPEKGSIIKRLIKLNRASITPTAKALHTQMYTAFAEGDTSLIRKICTDGLNDSFSTRIGSRAKGEKVKWELLKYNGRPRVVSDRAARLPIEGAAMRQAVVRIASKQKLTRWRRDGVKQVLVPGTGVERDVVEYVVLQRLWKDWKEGEWMVWGTTSEVSLDEVDEWTRKAKGL